jgi:hypothetical protein
MKLRTTLFAKSVMESLEILFSVKNAMHFTARAVLKPIALRRKLNVLVAIRKKCLITNSTDLCKRFSMLKSLSARVALKLLAIISMNL